MVACDGYRSSTSSTSHVARVAGPRPASAFRAPSTLLKAERVRGCPAGSSSPTAWQARNYSDSSAPLGASVALRLRLLVLPLVHRRLPSVPSTSTASHERVSSQKEGRLSSQGCSSSTAPCSVQHRSHAQRKHQWSSAFWRSCNGLQCQRGDSIQAVVSYYCMVELSTCLMMWEGRWRDGRQRDRLAPSPRCAVARWVAACWALSEAWPQCGAHFPTST